MMIRPDEEQHENALAGDGHDYDVEDSSDEEIDHE